MYAYGVLGIEDGIFILSVRMMSDARTRVIRQLAYLAGRIYDVTFILDAIEVDILCECALDSWIIGFDKVVLDELNHER